MRTFVGVVCAALVLVGCSTPQEEAVDPSKLDEAGQFACEDFGNGYASAQTGQARVELANTVNEWAPKSKTTGLAEAAKALGNAVDLAPGAWQLAADSFAQICLDASGAEQ